MSLLIFSLLWFLICTYECEPYTKYEGKSDFNTQPVPLEFRKIIFPCVSSMKIKHRLMFCKYYD